MVLNFIPRKPKKYLALGFIITGLAFATPPLVPFSAWTEIVLNIPVANFITEKIPTINIMLAFFLTFTAIPLILIYVGALVYPHNTDSILHGILSRIKNGIKKYTHLVKREPLNLIWLVVSIYILYLVYTYKII
jgi:hypothetical protein|tara:strand:- start:7169 stop:7570 length:402 start_codon:yes stop_codon:yes gene_type:complete